MERHTEGSNSFHEIVNRLYRAKVQVFVAVSIVASVILFVIGAKVNDTAQTALLGIATSLAASTVFGTLQLLITNSEFVGLVKSTATAAALDTANQLLALERQAKSGYEPLKEFPPSDQPDRSFNDDFSRELGASKNYHFVGLTGRYVGPRLAAVASSLRVSVVIGRPSSPAALDIRRRQDPPSSGSPDDDQLMARLQSEVDLCIFGLFAQRNKHERIAVAITDDPKLDRVEILDGCIYFALFSGWRGEGKKFPRTLKFGPQSWRYQGELHDAEHSCEAPALVITSGTGPAAIREFYREAFGRVLDEEAFGKLQESYQEFEAEFARQVNLGLP